MLRVVGEGRRTIDKELIRLRTADGLPLPGLLRLPGRRRTDWPVDAVACVHGATGDFASEPINLLAEGLAGGGLPALTFSNRGHDVVWQHDGRYYGYAYEDLAESTFDIDAAIAFLRAFGARRVLLLGHSLGAVKAALYAGGDPTDGLRSSLAAAVCVSPPRLSASFYESSRWAGEYRDAVARVDEQSALLGPEALQEPAFPFRRTLITARTYRSKFCAEAFDVARLAVSAKVPLLFTQGSLEAGPSHHGLIEDLSNGRGAACPRRVLRIDGADHFYTACPHALAQAVHRWLDEGLTA